MKLILSKIIRKYRKEQIPDICYAVLYLPKSLNKECDCVKFCKFTPRGNLLIANLVIYIDHSKKPQFTIKNI